VYAEALTTKENMIERIIIACRNISKNVLLSIVDSFQRQIQLYIDNNERVFEHLRERTVCPR